MCALQHKSMHLKGLATVINAFDQIRPDAITLYSCAGLCVQLTHGIVTKNLTLGFLPKSLLTPPLLHRCCQKMQKKIKGNLNMLVGDFCYFSDNPLKMKKVWILGFLSQSLLTPP